MELSTTTLAIFAVFAVMGLAGVVAIAIMSIPKDAEAQFSNPGQCINFGENKEISRELGNMSDYAKICRGFAPGQNK